jgi:amino acid permease
MKQARVTFEQGSILAATTIGAGIFSLPYLFEKSGWGTGLIYLIVLGVALAISHLIYWESLEHAHEAHLLGMVRRHLGRFSFVSGAVSIVGGLLFALTAYLILGAQFLLLIFPSLQWGVATLLFFALSVIPFFVNLKRFLKIEFWGALLLAAIFGVVFFLGLGGNRLAEVPLFVSENFFLPFGAVLFALSGWTAVGPMRDLEKKHGVTKRFTALWVGTAIVVALYFLFVVSVFNISAQTTPDTLSGLFTLPRWITVVMGFLGIFCLWTSYLPIGLEAQESLVEDLRIPQGVARASVTFLPLLLVWMGLSDFLSVVGLGGGVFLAVQYMLILASGQKILRPHGVRRVLFDVLFMLFLVGALYEIYTFMVG